MGDLTENFSRKEFACKCGCGFDLINLGLVHRLQLIRDISGVVIQILSGCRCPQHNEEVKGELNSYHMRGDAADWDFLDSNNLLEKLCTKLIQNWSGGFHFYPDKKFCHADVGLRRRW